MNTYIVSVVVIKSTSTGFNTQNILYEISAVSEEEAKGKTLGFISTDFPEHSLHTILTALVTPNPWQQAIDDELVNARLGIAKDEITREEAKAELNKLIAWHIDVAKYFDSQAQQPTVTDEMIAAAEAVEDLYRRGTPDTWKKVFLAMWREMPSEQSQALPPAPEVCTDGGKCGAGGYCITCPNVQEPEGESK